MITPTPEFWKVFKETNGALSCTEAVAIMNIAAQAPKGKYMELGVHLGKSAMAALCTLKQYDGSSITPEFILVDPIFEDIKLIESVYQSLVFSGVCNGLISIAFEVGYSTDKIPNHDNYAYVMVDSGSHQDGLPMQEVKLLEDRMVQGGIIAFHDYQSQFVEVHGAYDYLVSTGKYEPIPINWQEIIDYVNANNLEEGNSSWHHTEMRNPNFVGAVKRK